MAILHPYTTSSVARVFLDNVYSLHGLPATIISDMDVVFLSLSRRNYLLDKGLNCVTPLPVIYNRTTRRRWLTSA